MKAPRACSALSWQKEGGRFGGSSCLIHAVALTPDQGDGSSPEVIVAWSQISREPIAIRHRDLPVVRRIVGKTRPVWRSLRSCRSSTAFFRGVPAGFAGSNTSVSPGQTMSRTSVAVSRSYTVCRSQVTSSGTIPAVARTA